VIAFYKTLPNYDYPAILSNTNIVAIETPKSAKKSENRFSAFEYKDLENEEYIEPTSKKIMISNTTNVYKVKKTDSDPPKVDPPPIPIPKEENDSLCCICMDSKKCVLLIPCKHVCMCGTCGLREDITSCPLCVVKIENRMQIFI
jgi:hypothetical protein